MNTQDVLNIFLAIGFFVLVICAVFTSYFLIQALKSVTTLADNLDETTQNIKDKVQLKTLAAIPAILVSLVGKIIRKRR